MVLKNIDTHMITMVVSNTAVIALLAVAVQTLHRNRSRSGLCICLALTVTACLELVDMLALTASSPLSWKRFSLYAESLLPLTWILCSLTFARQASSWKIGRINWLIIVLTALLCTVPLVFPLNAIIFAPDFPQERILFLNTVGLIFYICLMAGLVFSLTNFEATLVNASPDALWRIKLELIGFSAIVAVLTFYYSQALLFRTINMNFLVVRSFLYVVASSLIAFSRLIRSGLGHVEISRHTTGISLVLLAFGAYLISIGFLEEGMDHFGVSFHRTAAISFVFLVGIGLLILLLSYKVRRRVKVAIHKNFFHNKYDYRNQWLQFTEQISTARTGDELFHRILTAYCDTFGFSAAALFLYDMNRRGYSMAACFEMDAIEDVIEPRNSLVRFMEERKWVFSVKDNYPEITGQNARFLCDSQVSFVVPLFDGSHLEGFIILGKVLNDEEIYIYEDFDLMKTIARQATMAIMHQKLSEQMARSREIEAIGKLSTFIAHDLKNLVANLSLIVQNAARHMHNPDFQSDMLKSLGNTVSKMQKLIGTLKNLKDKELNLQTVDLLQLATKTSQLIMGHQVAVSGSPETARVDEVEMQNVIMNLIINGIEASQPGTPIAIEVGRRDSGPFIRVIDHGCGMSTDYIRSELFKPFRTTKNHGLGIGMYQCQQVVRAHGGIIEVNSTEGVGSEFTILLNNGCDIGAIACLKSA